MLLIEKLCQKSNEFLRLCLSARKYKNVITESSQDGKRKKTLSLPPIITPKLQLFPKQL